MPKHHRAKSNPAEPRKPPPSQQPEPVGGKDDRPGESQLKDSPTRPHWADSAIAIFTGLMLIAYITSDYFLWHQLQLTESTVKLDQRAWIIVKQLSQVALNNGEPISIPIEVTNSGKTTALKVRGAFIAVITPANGHIDFAYDPYPKVTMRAGVILPNQPAPPITAVVFDRSRPESPTPVLLSNEMRYKVLSGELAVFIFGRIEYGDIFGEHHWINFCLQGRDTPSLGNRQAVTECLDYGSIDIPAVN